jgi:hypothetical protein
MHNNNDRTRSHSLELTFPEIPGPPWHLQQRHPRFLSDWNSAILKINISHSSSSEEISKYYDLSETKIARLGHVSIDGDRHYALKNFPDLFISLKLAINSMLFSRTEMIDDCIMGLINHSLRLFSWMINENIFKVSQLRQVDITRLRDNWQIGGWWEILGYQRSLNKVLSIVEKNPSIAKKLSGKSNNNYLTINTYAVNKMTGLPLSGNFIPIAFAKSLANIINEKIRLNRTSRPVEVTYSNFNRFMVDMNRFAEFPVELGAIPYIPFIDGNKFASRVFPNSGGRTKNISIDNAVRIAKEALRWTSEYKPVILAIGKIARIALEKDVAAGLACEGIVKEAVIDAYQSHLQAGGIEIPNIKNMTRGILRVCIETLITACVCLIAMNHGRRKNEIIGYKLPYGLYFGCIREISSLYEDWRIDIYIEKSARTYLSFWCNDIVREAVTCLEEISQLFRPLNSPLKVYPTNRIDGRKDKLFFIRNFTKIGFENEPIEFNFSRKASWFLELAGVDESYFNEKFHPFRRIFACIYRYRYDIFRIGALSEHYGHDLSSFTETYFTNAPGTSPADGVEAQYATGYGTDLVSFKKMMDEITSEMFVDLMLRLLSGELIGGNFAKLSLKLMKEISGNITFQELNLEGKAELISTALERDGYSLSEKEHGLCCATNESITKERSNCFANGEVHPENATPQVCSGCMHLLSTEGYRAGLIIAKNDLITQVSDFSLPAAERFQIKKNIAELDAYILSDEKIAQENHHTMMKLTSSWQKVFFQKKT